MWIYRAEDESGRFLAESRNELQLISKVWDEFGRIDFRIVRIRRREQNDKR